MESVHERRRAFVNKEVGIKLRGRKTSIKQKKRIFKEAWAEAKRTIN